MSITYARAAALSSASTARSRTWSRWARVVLTGAVALAGLVAGAGGAMPTASAAVTRTVGLADPVTDRVPAVSYAATCYASRAATTGAACQRLLVLDINAARAREGVRPLVLPRGYAQLPAPVQVFALTNLERVGRGLAPLVGLNATLSARARLGALAGRDPSIAAWDIGALVGQSWTSNQVSDANALEADWLWMYTDGWAGKTTTNADCTSARSTGCWGHRHNILATHTGSPVLVSGTAAVATGVFSSYAQLVLAGTGHAPKLTYTWAQALAAGADRD